MQISISRLRAYQACPQKFYYRYVSETEPEFLSSNLLFGQAMHHAIAAYHRSLNTIGSNGMNAEFLKYWKATAQACQATHQPLRMKGNEQELFLLAHDLCVEYVGAFSEIVPAEADDVELLFEVPLIDPQSGQGSLNHTLTGKIDLVANNSLYEFKTASRTTTQSIADSSIQITAYSLAHQYLYDRPAEHLYLVCLVKTKKPKIEIRHTTRHETAYQNLVEMGIQIAKAVDANIFYRNPETLYGCHTCEYQNNCLSSRQKKVTMEPETPF